MENLEFIYKNHTVVVSNAFGSNDGYYWDKTFFLLIDKTPYIMLEVGSGSGWIPNDNSLKKVGFDYLKSRLKAYNDLYNEVTISDFDTNLFESLFDFMLENNANEVNQDDDYKLHVIEKKAKELGGSRDLSS